MRLVGPPYTAGPRPGSCRGARSRDQDVITDLAFRGVCLQNGDWDVMRGTWNRACIGQQGTAPGVGTSVHSGRLKVGVILGEMEHGPL